VNLIYLVLVVLPEREFCRHDLRRFCFGYIKVVRPWQFANVDVCIAVRAILRCAVQCVGEQRCLSALVAHNGYFGSTTARILTFSFVHFKLVNNLCC